MCGALAEVVALAEAQRGDATKDHLYPGKQRHGLANDGVARANELADGAVQSTLPVALEVQTQDNLADQEELKNVGKNFVNVAADKLASAVCVTEEKAEKGEAGSENLERNMPSVLGDLGQG